MNRRDCRRRIYAIFAEALDGRGPIADAVANEVYGIFHEDHDRNEIAVAEVREELARRAGSIGPDPFGRQRSVSYTPKQKERSCRSS